MAADRSTLTTSPTQGTPCTSLAPDVARMLALLLEQTHDVALVLLDRGGRVKAWLGAAERIFGHAPHEVQGRPVDFLFTPEDRDQGMPAHEIAVASANSRADDDRWHVRKDGTRIWVTGVTIPLLERGEIVGFAKIARDRTDIKMQLDALSNRVQALGEQENQRVLFLKTLGHELRNPLAPLTTAVALLQRASDVGALRAPLAVIERQIAVIKRLAEDLTDLTRIDVGRLTLQFERLHLQEALGTLVSGYQSEAQRRGCALRLLVPEGPILLMADPARFQQIMMNLLQNALKYTPVGGRIWVKASTEAGDAIVRIEDTGVGIAPEMLPRIFDLFTQENPNSSESDGGLGIGLALVADLVRLHGGLIEVRSPGKGLGSEFAVRLPLAQPPA